MTDPDPDIEELHRLDAKATPGPYSVRSEALIGALMADSRCVACHVLPTTDETWLHDARFMAKLVTLFRSGQLVPASAVEAEREACAELADNGYHRAATLFDLPSGGSSERHSYNASAKDGMYWSEPKRPYEIAQDIRNRSCT